jgi:hypothetical protein
MIEGRNAGEAVDPVHLGFGEQRRPLLQGDARHYLMARGDQLAFTAEVVRFGFSPSDFALDIERVPGKHTPNSSVPTFTVTIRNIHRLHRATYQGGPGRAWVAEFLRDLIAGRFGQP